MNRLYTLYGLLLLCIVFNGPVANSQDWSLDKAKVEPIDSIIFWMSNNYYSQDIKDSSTFHSIALYTLNKAYDLKDDETIGDVHTQMANWHGYQNFYGSDSVIYHGLKAVEFYDRASLVEKVAGSYKNLSIDYMNNNSYDEAEEVLFKAIEIYEQLGSEVGIAGCYKNLSSMFRVLEEPQQSIKYADLAIPILKKNNDHYNHSITLLNLIISNRLIENFPAAYAAADECIEIIDNHIPDQKFIKSRAYSYRADVAKDAGDYEQMYDDAVKAWKIVEGALGEERSASYRTEVGDALRLQGKYREALPHFEAGIQALEERGVEQIWQPYNNLAETYENLGKYQLAYEYQGKAVAAKNIMIEDKISNLKSEAVIKYETGKKDQALAEQEVQLKHKTRIQWLSIGIAVLLGTLLFALNFNYRRNKKITAQLEKKNQENELLLKEINHRVKNNLQTISSLLNIQSKSIEDVAAIDAIQESKNRVASMALIHQKLYQGENLASIEMSNYFKTMGEAIIDGFGEKASNVSLEVEMEDLELDVDAAIPIGLITNELITNSIKYAFPGNRKGTISISLKSLSDDNYKLVIADDGVPAADKQAKKGTGFGSLLINLLTAQLGGEINISTTHGTAAIIQFPPQMKSAV